MPVGLKWFYMFRFELGLIVPRSEDSSEDGLDRQEGHVI